VVDGDSISPHHIILVSSRKDGDAELEQMDATKLAYDAAKRQLTYDGKALGRSYAVLEVKRADPPEVLRVPFKTAPGSPSR
jgi:hypothetical protein